MLHDAGIESPIVHPLVYEMRATQESAGRADQTEIRMCAVQGGAPVIALSTDTSSANGHDVSAVMKAIAASTNGAELLSWVEEFCRTYIAYPSEHAAVAHTLWIAHTHAMDAWDSTPRIAFLSPEPGSGKSRALEISELLVPNPVEAINATSAYLFRRISDESGLPTILFDEIDCVFGPKAKGENEEIRAVLNAGHRRGAHAGRCVVRGKEVQTEELPCYAAVAVAGLGWLPDSLLTRSVIIRMRRRAPTERVEPFRRRKSLVKGQFLSRKLAEWCQENLDKLSESRPDLPDGIADRNADVWEALIAIADCAGLDWPKRARVAAVALVADSKDGVQSLGVRLLADMKTVFSDALQLSTRDILDRLCALEESPWSDLKGMPMDARRLSHFLKDYGVKPTTIRIGETTPKGYTAAALHDAWIRYVPVAPIGAATPATSDTTQGLDL